MSYGSGRQVSFYAPPITFFNKVIIILMVFFFLLESILIKAFDRNILLAYLGLSLGGVKALFFNQLITYPFAGGSFFSSLFNGLIIWFIGSDIERIIGSKKYLILLIGSILFGALIYLFFATFIIESPLLLMIPMHGMTGICYALLVGYAIFYSDRILQFMLIFPMKAKYFCFLLVGVEVYMGIFSSQGAISLTHLSSMFFAFLMIQVWIKGLTIGNLKLFSFFSRFKTPPAAKKSHLTLVKDEENGEKSPQKEYWH